MERLKGIDYKYIVAAVSSFGIFMELLDTTVVNVAIPTLARDFKADTTTIEWIITGYLLSLAVFIPVSGWAGDRFGTRRTFIFAMVVFTVSSLLCALAWNIGSLIAFRVLQGVGGGMLTPVGTTMLFRAFPPAERPKASGFLVIPTTFAPASGPIVGGFLIDYLSWEWIFLVNLPVGILGILASVFLLKEQKEEAPGRFDVLGFVLGAAAMASILYALAEAGPHGFDDGRVILFGLVGLALLVSFIVVELRLSEPMIDVRLFGNRLFRSCTTAMFVGFTGFSSALFLLPIMLQAERGMSPFESGLTTFPMAIGVMLMAQPASRIYRVVGPRRMIATGLVLATVSSLSFFWVAIDTDAWVIRGLMLLRGFGFGLMLVPLQAATFATVAPSATGRASAVYSTARQIAQSLGVAIIATVLTARFTANGAQLGNPASRDAAMDSFHEAFLAAAVLTVVGVAFALFIRDHDAAPSMKPRAASASKDEQATVSAH